MITASLQLLLLSVFGSLLNCVFSSSPFTLQGQSFKESFHNFSRKLDQAENSGDKDSFASIKNGMNGWIVQAIFVDKTCGSTIFRTTGSRTGCLFDSQSSSLRVSCNSTMILMEQFAFSASCSGQPDSAWTTPVGQCLVSSYSSSVYSCIANPTTTSLPLPKGDWYTSIDNICKKSSTFYGVKSNVCHGGWGFSQILRWPLFFTYQSDTCTGRFSYDNVSIYTMDCDDAGLVISNHNYYLHSDGSSYKPATLSPTQKPSQKPSLRPNATPTRSPTMKPSRKPTFTPIGKPSLKPSVKPTGRPTIKPTSKPAATTNPSVKSKSIPTLKPSKAVDRSSAPSLARKPTGKPTTPIKKPTYIPTRKPTNKHMNINNPSNEDATNSGSESTPNDSQSGSHKGSGPIIAASVSLGALVMVGLFVWYYKKMHENNGKYVKMSRKEERYGNIEEIPEVL